ncbi:MAG TPA: type II secretion system F family protein [Acidimicrobiales bacterium]|nr:type II secretion system F family protein [Acidimicrobiales bacterium]
MAPATIGQGAHSVWQHLSNWGSSVADSGGAWLVVVLVVAAAALIGYAVSVLMYRPRRELEQILEPYRLHEPSQAPVSGRHDVVTVPALRRTSELLASALEARGWREAVERRLIRSGLPVGVGELVFLSLAVIVLCSLLGAILGGLIGFAIALFVGCVLPFAVLQGLAEQRTRRFTEQLPDVLRLLSGSLRAGFSLAQGLDAMVRDVKPPMNKEIQRALANARLGMPIEDALNEVADRIGSRDFAWTVMAIRIQREVGGNLAEILDTVAKTMIERGRLRREVRTLTAEGRISAIILAALPVVLGGFIFIINRAYIDQLFHTTGGEIALFGAIALELFGGWWMYRTIQIEV